LKTPAEKLNVVLLFASACIKNVQTPAGILVTPGTPLSVANGPNVAVAPDAIFPEFQETSPVLVGFGLNCLYAGEPNVVDAVNE